jgi:hypothetical protein
MDTGLFVEETNRPGCSNNTAMIAAWTEDIGLTRGIGVTPVKVRD